MRILIVGAGIAGLALAHALHRRGSTPEVVERVSDWQPIGAGLYLPGNAVRALRELGIEVPPDANPIRRSASSTIVVVGSPRSTSTDGGTASAVASRFGERHSTRRCEKRPQTCRCGWPPR